MTTDSPKKFALVLSAGGARAAYQVGVLKHLALHHPSFQPTIFSATSAGSINAIYLAQGEPLSTSASLLYRLWENLTFDDVFRTNFQSMFSVTTHVINDLVLSNITKKLLFKSVLDASPLAATLSKNMRFSKMWKAVASGTVQGIAICATNYQNGSSTIFFDSSQPIPPWHKEARRVVRTGIRLRHIMASCSIPILFEPVRIGDALFGDGSIRQTHPFSPAIRLGATHALGIGVNGVQPNQVKLDTLRSPSLGFVAGVVLDSIFLDSLEPDFDFLCRFNEIAKKTDALRYVQGEFLRPSVDPGEIAKEHIEELPFHLRKLVRTTTINPSESGQLLSYLLFSKGYLKAMLELGEKDAEAQADKIDRFIQT